MRKTRTGIHCGLLFGLVATVAGARESTAQPWKPKDEVRVESVSGTDFEAYATYDWSKSQGPGNAENMANHIRITRAIQRELDARGIEPDTTKPGLLVLYEATRRKELKGTTSSGVSVEPTNQRTNLGLESVEVASLTITLFDGETNRTLWKALLRQELETPDKSERQINRAVAKIFEKFPVPAKEDAKQ